MASDKRVHVTLECTECKRRNYITNKSKVNDRERIELKKYCRWDRKHTRAQGDALSPRGSRPPTSARFGRRGRGPTRAADAPVGLASRDGGPLRNPRRQSPV